MKHLDLVIIINILKNSLLYKLKQNKIKYLFLVSSNRGINNLILLNYIKIIKNKVVRKLPLKQIDQ